VSQATLEELPIEPSLAPEVAFDAATVPICEKCGLPNAATACRRCGWYPVLGIHVEIDDAYEAAMLPPATPNVTGVATAAAAKPDWRNHLAVWRGLVPGWAWLLIGTTLGCLGAGVTARIATLDNPSLQTWCGVIGLVGGLIIALTAHIVAFVLCSFDDANFGVADIIVKPLKTWRQIARGLPEKIVLANSANFGVSLALTAALVVGGIPYERLLDWGFTARPKQSLVGAITSAAAEDKAKGADSLEGAVNDFAGEADADGLGAAGASMEDAKPREKLECLVIGYHAGKSGGIQGLLLATDVAGKLTFVGQVQPELEASEAIDLLKKFEQNHSSRPLVKTSLTATWLRPRFTCRVTYSDWPNGQRPKELQWDQMLDEVQLPW
jgi:ribosomal protein L40E